MHADDTSRRIDQPEPGFFRRRLVARGWAVPARIVHEDGLWRAEINGIVYPPHAVAIEAPKVLDIWQYDELIGEAEWRWREAMRLWAVACCPTHPAANPDQPINLLTVPISPIPHPRTP